MKPINHLIAGISLAILIVAPMSMAQVIEEITVTARKKSENLQDVPISVNVITSDMLDRMGVRDLQDVTKLDPSLIFDKGFAPDDIRVVVRGIDNGRGRPVVATIIDGVDISSEALATAGASQLISPTLIDIERIEIVKGPQIALYGRTAFAGAISYVTKGASEELEINTSVEVAQDGFHEARISASGPASDNLGIRFNALTWSFDGFHENTVTGNKVGGGEGHSASILFDWNPVGNEKLSIRTRIDTIEDKYASPAQAFVPYNQIAAVPADASWCNGGWVHDASCNGYAQALEAVMAFTPAQAGLIPFASPWYPLKLACPFPGCPMIPDATKTGYGSNGGQIDQETGTIYGGRFDDMEHWVIRGGIPDGDSLFVTQDVNVAHPGGNRNSDMFGSRKEGERMQINLEYDMGVGTFSSITHIADMQLAQQYDIDKQALAHFNQEWDVNGPVKLFSQEFRLQTESDGPFNMAVGALYWHEKKTQTSTGMSVRGMGERCFVEVLRDADTGNIISLTDLGLSYFQGPCGHTDIDIREFQHDTYAARPPDDMIRDTVSASLYSLIDYEFNDRLTMTLELRWVDEREKLTASQSQGLADGGATNSGASSVSLCGSHIRCDATGGFVAPGVAIMSPVVIGCDSMTTSYTPGVGVVVTPCSWWAATPTRFAPTTRQEPLTYSMHDNYITPKLVMRYELTDDAMLYGSFAEAKKPGGFSTLGTGAFGFDPDGDGQPTEVIYKPEAMEVWEIGFKTRLADGRLRLNSAFFFEDYTDKQTQVQKVFNGQLGSVTENANGGEAVGFEVDLAYAVTDQFSVSGGYTYLDTEYTDFTLPSRSAGELARVGNCTRVDDYLGSGDGTCLATRNGNQFERAPKHAATINLMYEDELQLGDANARYFVELNSRFQDKRFIDNSNDAYVKDYWRFDLRVGVSSGPWDAVLYVENLMDDDTVLSASTGPDIGGSGFRFGFVTTKLQHSVRPYPGGPVVATYVTPDITGQYGNGSNPGPKIVPAPMIRNMWYANLPDPRQVGMRLSYKF
jgi:outer membrane receptor protein involved in Fe transport